MNAFLRRLLGAQVDGDRRSGGRYKYALLEPSAFDEGRSENIWTTKRIGLIVMISSIAAIVGVFGVVGLVILFEFYVPRVLLTSADEKCLCQATRPNILRYNFCWLPMPA